MKTEKGITLMSLAIYIAVLLIVLGILATVTGIFKGNIKEINSEGTNNYEIDKFNIYFLKEVKKQGNEIDTIANTEILFTTGNKYAFDSEDKCIYLNDNIKIAENIETCVFSSNINEKEDDERTVITVTIQAINAESKMFEYVLSEEAYTIAYEDEEDYIHINSVLPIEYQQLDYIACTGTQYIDTGYIFKNKPKIVGEIMITSGNDFDIMGNATAKAGCFIIDTYVNSTSSVYYRYSSANYTNASLNIRAGTWYDFEFSDKVTVNGSEKLSISTYDFTANDQSFLIGKGRTYGYARFKEIKMYDGEELVRDMIPCYRKKNKKTGMYDLINGIFYTDINGGEFDYQPLEDCELEYIETSGTQYIDTGYIFKNKPKIVGEIMITSGNDFDIMGNATAKAGCFIIDTYINYGPSLYYRYSSASYTRVVLNINTGIWYDFEFSDKVTVNGSEKLSISTYDFTANDQSFLIGKGRTYGYARFKEIKMYDGEELVRDMVPYYSNENNEIGMYDKVNDVFYPNLGSGSFINGPVK